MGLFSRLKTYTNGGKLFPSDLNTLQDGIAAVLNHIGSANIDDGTILPADLAGGLPETKLAAFSRADVLPSNSSMAVSTFFLTWGARNNIGLGSPNFDVLSYVNGSSTQGFAVSKSGVWAIDLQLYFQHSDSTRKLRMVDDIGREWAHSVKGDHGPGDGSYLHLAFTGYLSSSSDGPFYFELANGFSGENFSTDGSGGRRSRIRCAYLGA